MHAIVLAIVLFLSNGHAQTTVQLHDIPSSMTAAEAQAFCVSQGDAVRHELIGATDPNDEKISVTDVEYTCGIVTEAKAV